MFVRYKITHFLHGHFCWSFVCIDTMCHRGNLKGFNNTTCYFSRKSVLRIADVFLKVSPGNDIFFIRSISA